MHMIFFWTLDLHQSYLDHLLDNHVVSIMENDNEDRSLKATTSSEDRPIKGKGITHYYV